MRLVRLAMLLVDDPLTAEDVVQEAFTGLHRHWSGLRDEAAAVAYLRTAVVNGSRSVLRRRRTARDYVPPHQVNARSAESLAMLSAEHQAVVDALATLPPRQREVLVLRYYGGLSESEIADATGISRGTVKSTASRAMDAVARAMDRWPGRSMTVSTSDGAGAQARRGDARAGDRGRPAGSSAATRHARRRGPAARTGRRAVGRPPAAAAGRGRPGARARCRLRSRCCWPCSAGSCWASRWPCCRCSLPGVLPPLG